MRRFFLTLSSLLLGWRNLDPDGLHLEDQRLVEDQQLVAVDDAHGIGRGVLDDPPVAG